MKCPHCDVPGELKLVHISRRSPSLGEWVRLPCHTCHGTNQIDDEYGRRITVGRALRNARVARGESQRQYAENLKVSPVTLSQVEAGKLIHGNHIELWNRLTGEQLSYEYAKGEA